MTASLEHQHAAQLHRPKTLDECAPAVRELVAQGHSPADVAEMLALSYDAVMRLLASAS